MKICLITDDLTPDFIGGGGVYAGKLTLKLTNLDQNITIISPATKARFQCWKKIRNVNFIGINSFLNNPLIISFLDLLQIKLQLNTESFDVLHANQHCGFFLALFKPKNVKVLVVSVHHTYFEMAKFSREPVYRLYYSLMSVFEKFTYSKADSLIFNTESEAGQVRKWFNLTQPYGVIPLGTDLVKYSPREQFLARKNVRRKLGISPTKKIILYVGRLVPKKNVDQLIRAVSILNLRQVTLLIVGAGRQEKYLRSVATTNIHFLGFVKNLRPYFLASDCFATIGEAEGGVAISTLEAASFGLPLVLSPSDSGNPILSHGKNGVIVNPRKIDEISRGIVMALKNQKKFSQISRQLAAKLTWNQTARKTLNFYQEILEKVSDRT